MINKPNKSKALISIIAILLVANIAMVAFFLLKKDDDRHEKPRVDRRAMIANFLRTEIGFDSVQLQQYDTLSLRHKEGMRKMFDSLRMAKEKQFKNLTAGNFNDSVLAAEADQSAANQKVMELKMFNHLKSVRMLCTPEQLPKFDSLFVKVLSRRGGEGRKKHEEKK